MNHAHHPSEATEDELRTQIREVEAHLAHIANEDNSAYGKARIRLYEAMLQERRQRLSLLNAVHHDRSTSHDYL
jgi:hypothetical protein